MTAIKSAANPIIPIWNPTIKSIAARIKDNSQSLVFTFDNCVKLNKDFTYHVIGRLYLDKEGNLDSLVFKKDFFDHRNNPEELLDGETRLVVAAAIITCLTCSKAVRNEALAKESRLWMILNSSLMPARIRSPYALVSLSGRFVKKRTSRIRWAMQN